MHTTLTADDTRTRILKEAERLFRHFGYAKTTVADIADACEMSSANVYRFFASKSKINEAICARIISAIGAKLTAIAYSEAPASKRLADFIAAEATHTVETLLDQKKVHDMVVVAMSEHWGAVREFLAMNVRLVAHIIESGIVAGEFKQQDVEQAAKCVHASLCALTHPVVVAQCLDDPIKPTPQEMAAFIVSALKA